MAGVLAVSIAALLLTGCGNLGEGEIPNGARFKEEVKRICPDVAAANSLTADNWYANISAFNAATGAINVAAFDLGLTREEKVKLTDQACPIYLEVYHLHYCPGDCTPEAKRMLKLRR